MSKDKIPSVTTGWFDPNPLGRKMSEADGTVLNHRTGEYERPESMTKQSFVVECDINNIIREYSMNGVISHISANADKGQYLDLPESLDYQQSLNTIIKAEASFASLPSAVRNRFENDPAKFLAFIQDPANQDEAIQLGLAKDTRPPKPEPEPAPPPLASSAPAPEIKP